MFELLITILLALGLTPTKTDNGMLIIDNTIVTKAKSDGRFESSGGDAAMYSVAVVNSVPSTEIVVTDELDPNAVH